MDWPVTHDYCRAFAEAFGMPIRYSWRVGGFEREMLRENTPTAAVKFEDETGNVIECGGKSNRLGTRMKFPQVSANLSVRWCSAYLKIDVCALAVTNQPRFRDRKTLIITGERAQESSARANYKTFEPDRADNRDGKRVVRHVDHWRPVHGWDETQIWDIIEKYRVNPHPAYHLGWGRLSCMACIFGSPDQWASVRRCDRDKFNMIARYEEQFDCTIHRTRSVSEQADRGAPYAAINRRMLKKAVSDRYSDRILLKKWELPAGAFGESTGPT